MKVIYNSRLLSDENVTLNIDNRAFCYGDGLFETIVTGPERLNLLDLHIERLRHGCAVLAMDCPKIGPDELLDSINQLAKVNALNGDLRTRFQVWRNSGGKYTPDMASTSFLITVESCNTPFYRSIKSLGVCKAVHVHESPISFAKTMNALFYVLAGIEKDGSPFDDLLITNGNGHLAETTSSNIFWTKGDIVYTPSLKSGCIAGIMRKYVMNSLCEQGRECHEVLVEPEELDSADTVFLTNTAGITWVGAYNNIRELTNPMPLLDTVIKQPLHP